MFTCEFCAKEFERVKQYTGHLASHSKRKQLPWNEMSYEKKRKLLIEEANFACTVCGFDKKRPNGGVILEIDHIDGDHKNNSRENLRVLCPNCHAMTPNFRAWGRTRKQRSSTRVRRDAEYLATRQRIKEEVERFDKWFIDSIDMIRKRGDVDFMKFGWQQKITDELKITRKVLQVKMRKLMYDFYTQCMHPGYPARIDSSGKTI